ncbi:hypothetical protein EDB92DRAFT_1869836 [Lactarius akahatsu]|uniref:Uncharacterized protein n=1 Tax=Lactarius akahatsu TaxID=416441 RepID=A0AAD4Q704_9AGAM|nr:hypothetical protein EDB92DRAFT_1869836 [Lactarius akahatsu]
MTRRCHDVRVLCLSSGTTGVRLALVPLLRILLVFSSVVRCVVRCVSLVSSTPPGTSGLKSVEKSLRTHLKAGEEHNLGL